MKQFIWIFAAILLICNFVFGQTYTAGRTYASFQHQGSCGRMIGVDDEGRVHVVWMNVLNPAGTNRQVMYNFWESALGQFAFPDGTQAHTSARAGYACLAVQPDGFCFPAFHEAFGTMNRCAASIDFLPAVGAFTSYGPATLYENGQPVEILWPMLAQDAAGTLHMVGLESLPNPAQPGRLYYARGTPEFDPDGFGMSIAWADFGGAQWRSHDLAMHGGYAVVASRSSLRIALARMMPPDWPEDTTALNNDVLVQWSQDGGQGWSRILNITDFAPPDYDCHAATHDDVCCSRDTLRAYNDLSVFLDNADTIHVVFTTITRYQWENGVDGPVARPNKAALWHWREGPGGPRVIAHCAVPDSLLPANFGLGVRHTMLERPCLAQDAATGYLYCSFLKYDTAAISADGYFNADAWITMSTDGGATWAEATNVTNTAPPVVPAPAGSNQSERDATLAERVTDGVLHLTYTLDRNGNGDSNGLTQNNVLYRRVPITAIAAGPPVPYYPLHVQSVECDTIILALPPATKPAVARSIIMYGARPNPFNAATEIRFDLPRRQAVTLQIYDLLGQSAATLHTGALEAGEHAIRWNAVNFPSGVYFVSLQSATEQLTQKVLLLK